MKRITIILSLLILIIIGCSKKDTKKPEIQFTDCIMPLAEGNYWVYTDSTYVNNSHWEVETAKIGITGSTQIDFQGTKRWVYYWTWYDMPENKQQDRKTLVFNEDEGLYYYGQKMGSSYSQLRRSLFIKYPVNDGDEWNFAEGMVIRSVSTGTRFETPAGVFNAYIYQLSSQNRLFIDGADSFGEPEYRREIIQYLYYVPEIGYVGLVVTQDGVPIMKRRLVEYKVKEPQN